MREDSDQLLGAGKQHFGGEDQELQMLTMKLIKPLSKI